jgi:hypothetical protein
VSTNGRSRLLVFSGPTIPPAAVRALCPACEARPPVCAGDLLRLDLAAGDRVLVIDGFMGSVRAVRHKELLAVMEDGVEVWGCSSMGALRAAELSAHGMQGLGVVYNLYARGELDGDDEVAVLHLDARHGYRPVTESLVNLRHTVRAAVAAEQLDGNLGRRLIAGAARLPFHDRSLTSLAALVCDRPLERAALVQSLERNRVDVKRADAERALAEIGDGGSRPGRRPASPANPTVYLNEWRFDVRREVAGASVGSRDVMAYAACFLDDWPRLLLRAVCEQLVGMSPPHREDGRAGAIDRLVAPLSGELVTMAAAVMRRRGISLRDLQPASARYWVGDGARAAVPEDELLCRLAARTMSAAAGGVPWWRPLEARLVAGGVMNQLVDRVAVMRRTLAAAAMSEATRGAVMRSGAVETWFGRRWGSADVALACLDRGFAGIEQMRHLGWDCYQYDRRVGVGRTRLADLPVDGARTMMREDAPR